MARRQVQRQVLSIRIRSDLLARVDTLVDQGYDSRTRWIERVLEEECDRAEGLEPALTVAPDVPALPGSPAGVRIEHGAPRADRPSIEHGTPRTDVVAPRFKPGKLTP